MPIHTLRRGQLLHCASYSSGNLPLYSSAIRSPTAKLGAQQPARHGVVQQSAPDAAAPVAPAEAPGGAAAVLLPSALQLRKNPAAGACTLLLLLLLPWRGSLVPPLLLLLPTAPLAEGPDVVLAAVPGGPKCSPGSSAAAESGTALHARGCTPACDCCSSCCLLSRLPAALELPAPPAGAAAVAVATASCCRPLPPLWERGSSCKGSPLLLGLSPPVTARRSMADALLRLRLWVRLKAGEGSVAAPFVEGVVWLASGGTADGRMQSTAGQHTKPHQLCCLGGAL